MQKVILITGGSDGLGKAIARYLSAEFQVIILSPTEEKLRKAAQEVGCDYVVADVSDHNSLARGVSEVIEKHRRIDCLVNCAGLWIEGELDKNNWDQITKVIEVNCLGVLFASKVVIPQMKKQKSGLIVNISSQGGLYAKAERSVYSAAKWGITGFTKSLQGELAKYGISVTGIYPGKMKTQMFEKVGVKKDMADGLDTKEVARLIGFLLETSPLVNLPEIGIKNINN